jgi:hypothetical protein
MRWGRFQTGSALAAALLAGTSIISSSKDGGLMWLKWLLIGSALLLLLLTFAPILPLLRALPVIGAIRLEAVISSEEVSRTARGPEQIGAQIVLRVGVTNLSRTEVRRARVNVLVPADVLISASDGFGDLAPPGTRGQRLPDTSEPPGGTACSAVWAERADLGEGPTLLHYLLNVERPGTYPVRVKIESRGLYKQVEVDTTFSVLPESE